MNSNKEYINNLIYKYLNNPKRVTKDNYMKGCYIEKLIINELSGGTYKYEEEEDSFKDNNIDWNSEKYLSEININKPDGTYINFLSKINSDEIIDNYFNKGTCKLLSTSKKSKFYIFDYVPSTDLIDHDKFNIIDRTSRSNCCNCFTFSIYILPSNRGDNSMFEMIANFLQSIKISVHNIVSVLPDWVVKIYIDINVINLIKYISINDYSNLKSTIDIIINNLEYLFDHSNTELYITSCQSEDNKEEEFIGYKRSYRSIPLMEEDVNIVSMRDADAIVSLTECYNIKYFTSQPNKYFYLTHFNYGRTDSFKHDFSDKILYGYSEWLKRYVLMNKDFYSEYFDVFDLLAGLTTFKLKIKRDIYLQKIKETHEYVNNPVTFDEVFLKHLFKGLLTYSKGNKEEYDLVSGYFLYIYDDDVHQININIDEYEESKYLLLYQLTYFDIDETFKFNIIHIYDYIYEKFLKDKIKAKIFIYICILCIFDRLMKFHPDAGKYLMNIQLNKYNPNISTGYMRMYVTGHHNQMLVSRGMFNLLNICCFNNKPFNLALNQYFEYIWCSDIDINK